MHKYVSIEVEIYKLSLSDTEMNLYSESSKKVYFNPLRFFCLVNKDEQTMNDIDTGMDTTQTLQFKFLRDDLTEKELVLSEGDIIKFDERFYEIDNVNSQQYWMGRNLETIPVTTEGRVDQSYGYNVSIVAQTHLTRLSQLNLQEVRSGINSPKHNLPRNL